MSAFTTHGPSFRSWRSIAVFFAIAGAFALSTAGCASSPSADDGGQPELATDAGDGGGGGAVADAPLDDGLSDPNQAPPAGDPAGPGASAGGKSLFDRVGGKSVLDAVASDFVDMLADHPSFASNPAVSKGLKKDPARHKQLLADYLCKVSGGPCSYKGRNLKAAHAGMKVTEAQWKTMGGLFIKALRKNNVPKAERRELAEFAAANKPIIVEGN